MKNSRLFLTILIVALLLSSCGGGAAEEAAPDAVADVAEESAPEATTAPEATEEPTDAPPSFPETNIVGVLGVGANNTYKVEFGSFAALDFTEADLPAAPGSVEAHWYQAGGVYVVAYMGLEVSGSESLCPGNSILTSNGFEYVSNAPTADGACNGFSTLTTDPNVGPRVCQDTLVYVSAIPSSLTGTMFGTLEALADEGSALIGLTSQAESSGDAPEIDLDAICG
jgi:hypothetical protein